MLILWVTLQTLPPVLAGAMTASASQALSLASDTSESPFLPPPAEVDLAVPRFGQSPRLPARLMDDTLDETPGHFHYPLTIGNESQDTPWSTDSDYFDFSGLNYDCAPLIHLQECLEPFRLPESEHLFGREGVLNYLLDERLAIEEPFQAAMGLVLLSKLGLEW